MVRVLTAHHFGGQDIQTCEDPVAAAAIKPTRLLIALARHVVEVRDLEAGGAVVSTFPTADKVALIEHCKTGNYVATLEGRNADGKVRKPKARTKESAAAAAVRVYSNWETGLEPMRARIAGRVTPSRCEINSLEMIEIPLKRKPTGFACCQTTGNILVACWRTLFLYTYSVHKLECSQLTYIDFNDSDLSLALSFAPIHVRICEDLIAASGKHALLVCRISPEGSWKQIQEEEEEREPPSPGDNDTLSMKRLLKMERDILLGKKSSKHFPMPFPMTVHLPSVVAERASRGNCSPGSGIVHQTNPFVADPVDVKVSISCSWEIGAQVETLLRLQLAGDQSGNVDQFGSLVIQPVYSFAGYKGQHVLNPKVWPLHSAHRDCLYGVAILIATQQEGYLYHFAMDGRASSQPYVSIYPFTAPVTTVVLESCALHALTETGLETYTLRSYHRTLAKLQHVTLPEDDPISLIGLRPFLGVKQLLVTDWQLVLLATSDGSPNIPSEGKSNLWTFYSLKLPGPEVLFSDMLAVGESHKVASPTTYRQLLVEAHCIIARYNLLYPSIPKLLIPPSRKCSYDALKSLYRKSCVLLADYLIISDEREEIDLATKWYYRSALPLNEVIERINKNVSQRVVPDENEEILKQRIDRARCYFLFNVLAHCRKKRDGSYKNEYIESICKDDQTCRFLANSVLDEFEKQLPPDTVESPANYLAYLVLNSPTLADYALQRTLDLLQQSTAKKKEKDAMTALALVLLLVQQGNNIEGKVNKVSATLHGIDSEGFVKVVSDFWEILIDHNEKENRLTFSEVAAVLMEHKSMEMASLLAKLVMENAFSLEHLPKMLIGLMSSRLGKSSRLSHVFQRFLELFFDSYFSQAEPPLEMNKATHEALKILVRTYLSDLQMSNSSASSHQTPSKFILLERSRHSFLDFMPPFGPAINELLTAPRKNNKKESANNNNNNNNNGRPATLDIRSLSLKKLQSLLCSGRLTDDCFKETLMFVGGNPHLYGNLSLQVLCMKSPEGVNVIVEYCPKAALRYGQEVLAPDKWKLLIDALVHKIENLSYSGVRLQTEREDRSLQDSISGTGTITPRSDEADAGSESIQSSSSESEAIKLVYLNSLLYDEVLADVLEYLSGQLTVEEFWDLLSTTKAFNTSCVIPPMKNNPSGTLSITLPRSGLEPTDEDAVLKYHEYLTNCLHNENARIVRDCLINTGSSALAELYP